MTLVTNPPLAPNDLVASCRRQQQAWQRLPVRQRLEPVRRFRRLLVAECDRIAEAVARDLGKSADETLSSEVLPLADACRFLEGEAARVLGPRRVSLWLRPVWLMGQTDTVHRRPHGVVGVVGTWNYPLYLNGVQILHALTAGNGVVWKPSEVAPATAEALFDLVGRSGYPDGLVQKLEATREAGRALVESDVDHVVFTGSSATGRQIARALAERLVSSTLELSGCDALFVLNDADVGMAARATWFGATLNRGQTCLAVRRVLVQRARYPEFVEALRPLAAGAAPVRLALASQVEQATRLVRDALAGGARLLDGTPPEGNGGGTFRPTVVVDARPEMAVCREAYFAPLTAVMPFDTTDDALRMDAACEYGLGGSVFTKDLARGEELAGRLRTGTVIVNDAVVGTGHPATPFGGRGTSGWGVTQGADGLLALTVPQVVSVRGGAFRPHYGMAAGGASSQGELVRALLRFAHGATFADRCRGAWQMARAMLRMRKT